MKIVPLTAMAVLCGMGVQSHARGEDSVENLSRLVVQRRLEVEEKASALRRLQDDLAALRRQQKVKHSESVFQVEKLRSKLKVLQRNISLQKKQIAEANRESETQVNALLEDVERVADQVRLTPPVQKEERLNTLEKLQTGLESDSLTARQGYRQLVEFLQREKDLRQSVGVFRQLVTSDGKAVPATLVHVGYSSLFFRTNQDQVGFLQETDRGNYQSRVLENGAAKEHIEALIAKAEQGQEVSGVAIPLAVAQLPEVSHEN